MRKIYYISTILLILTCKNESTEIRYYPSESNFSTERTELLGLDTTYLNFRQITNKVASYYDKSEYLTIEFDDERIKKRITPYVYTGGLIKYKNVLRITTDSILIDDNYSISELKGILKRHYQNKGTVPQYSDSPKKAIVEVTIDTSRNGKELKNVLLKLTRAFDEIKEEVNDTIELKIFFNYFWQISPPLPPPKI